MTAILPSKSPLHIISRHVILLSLIFLSIDIYPAKFSYLSFILISFSCVILYWLLLSKPPDILSITYVTVSYQAAADILKRCRLGCHGYLNLMHEQTADSCCCYLYYSGYSSISPQDQSTNGPYWKWETLPAHSHTSYSAR